MKLSTRGVVVAVTVAAHVYCSLSRAKMARPVRGCPTPWSQQKGTETESNPSVPQQKEQPDAAEDEDIVDYDLDIDYEGSEPENEQAAQEEKGVDCRVYKNGVTQR